MFSFFRQRPAATKPPRRNYRPQVEAFEDRLVPTGGLSVVYFASSIPGQYGPYDPSFTSPGPLAVSPTGQVAIGVYGATPGFQLYDLSTQAPPTTIALDGYVEGIAYNGTNGFEISSNGITVPAEFVFAVYNYNGGYPLAEIEAYSPLVGTVVVANLGQNYQLSNIAIGTNANGNSFLYVINNSYSSGVLVFDQNFNPVSTAPNAFQDPNYVGNMESEYAEGLQVAGNHVFLMLSLYNYNTQTQTPVVDEFNLDGTFVRSIPFANYGQIAIAPADFPSFGGDLLVTDYTTGFVNAYSIDTGAFLGSLADASGAPIVIPQVRTLAFGPNLALGAGEALYFDSNLQTLNVGPITFNGLFGVVEILPTPRPASPMQPMESMESMLLQTAPHPVSSPQTPTHLPLHDFAPAALSLVPEGASGLSLSQLDAEQGPGWIANDSGVSMPTPIAPVAQAPAADPVPTTAVIGAPDLPAPTSLPTTIPVDGDNGPPVETKPMPDADPEQSTSSRIEEASERAEASESRLGAMPIVAAVAAGTYVGRPGKSNLERKRRRRERIYC